jgi:aromatic ring-opening dioxygenase catalytic subunit (LigB family)
MTFAQIQIDDVAPSARAAAIVALSAHWASWLILPEASQQNIHTYKPHALAYTFCCQQPAVL